MDQSAPLHPETVSEPELARDEPPSERTVVVVIAGGADPPAERTPLAESECRAMDSLARRGTVGLIEGAAATPWDGFLDVLGLQGGPALGVAAAQAAGIDVPADQVAYRADFVTSDDQGIRDIAAGGVDGPEAQLLLESVAAACEAADHPAQFGRLPGPRNLALLPGPVEPSPTPEEAVGRDVTSLLDAQGRLRPLYELTRAALREHDVNAVRVDLGENPANALWFHGGGTVVATRRAPAWWGERSALLVGDDPALLGLSRWADWPEAIVGTSDEELAASALSAIGEHSVVVVRTSSVRSAAASGDPVAKRDALSAVDARLVAPLLGALEERGTFRLLVVCDGVVETATHRRIVGPLPFAAFSDIGQAMVAVAHDETTDLEGAPPPPAAAASGNDRAFTEMVCTQQGLRVRPADLPTVFGN